MGSVRYAIRALALAVTTAGLATTTFGQATTRVPSPATAPTTTPETPPPAYEFRGGRWIPIEPAGPATQKNDEVLDRAEDYLQRGGWQAAHTLLIRWFDTHDRRAQFRDRATFLLAEVYFQKGDRVLSFYHFDEVMDLYPESKLYPAALQRQYDIADAYLAGYKNRIFYMAIVGAEDEAIEMLYRIQNRAPGSPLAEKSLLRTADYYFATSQFDLASDTYGAYLDRYKRSPITDRIKLRRAYSQIALSRGTRFDETPIIDARELLSDLVVTAPALAAKESIPAEIVRIDYARAQKLLLTGDWYKKTNQPRGAVYLYRLLLANYPDSPYAPEARAKLDRIPESLQTDPEPSTRPASEAGATGDFVPPPPTRPATTPATAPKR